MKVQYTWEPQDIKPGLRVKGTSGHTYIVVTANFGNGIGDSYNLFREYSYHATFTPWYTAAGMATKLNQMEMKPGGT